MIDGTITLKHNITGKLYYTFAHWPHQDVDGIDCLSVTSELPDNKTRLVDWVPVNNLEVVE